MSESILDTVKSSLLIVDTYTAYDTRIITLINVAISELDQIGYIPAEGFTVTDNTQTWDQLIYDHRFDMVKGFILEKVQLMFDPPSSSFALDAMQKDCEELSVRIRYEVESGD